MDEDNRSMQLCQDCRHSFIPVSQWIFLPVKWMDRLFNNDDSDQWYYRCRKVIKEQRTEFNPVTGSKLLKQEHKLCVSARDRYNQECGPEGKLWTPKYRRDFLVWLKRV